MKLTLIALLIFLINVPFGYWRANVKKFSFQWALSIHIPVPIVILLRIYSDIGFALYTYPILVGAFFGGQLAGKFLRNKLSANQEGLSSCLIMDIYRMAGKGNN